MSIYEQQEALTFVECSRQYRSFHDAVGSAKFSSIHDPLFKMHRDGDFFNTYRFWEDIVLLAAEAFDERV